MARRRLQGTRGLLGAAQARQQPAEREPRRRRLALGALRDEAIVEQARLAQLARGLARARLVERRARAAVELGGARPLLRALQHAGALERPPAAREGLGDGAQRLGRVGTDCRGQLDRARRELGVERQSHGQRGIAEPLRERQRVGEPPDALVELHGAREIAALDADARRLDVGTVGDEVLDDVAVVR